MGYPIYITHELIMEGSKLYTSLSSKHFKQDFDRIDSISRIDKDDFFVKGRIHLYGYKIEGEGPYSGFYDVINQQIYTKENIKNATIIEHKDECIYDSPIRPKVLRK